MATPFQEVSLSTMILAPMLFAALVTRALLVLGGGLGGAILISSLPELGPVRKRKRPHLARAPSRSRLAPIAGMIVGGYTLASMSPVLFRALGAMRCNPSLELVDGRDASADLV